MTFLIVILPIGLRLILLSIFARVFFKLNVVYRFISDRYASYLLTYTSCAIGYHFFHIQRTYTALLNTVTYNPVTV